MFISDVAWIRDHRRQPGLQLCIDGYLAHIPGAQRQEHLRRGLVRGVDFFTSEWRDQATHPFISAAIEPGLDERDLAGCTDDPLVFGLYQEMCGAIRAGTWRPGPRPTPSADGQPEASAHARTRTWRRDVGTVAELHV